MAGRLSLTASRSSGVYCLFVFSLAGRTSRIVYPRVIKFRNFKKENELRVTAVAPVMIENRALGYRITYQLEHFS